MIRTFQALAVAVLAVLPGALYVFGVERQTGRWGVTLSDRLLRFTAAIALLQALLAPATYQAYRTLVHTGWLSQGRPLAWWTWPVVLGYLALPAVAGDRVGRATRQRKPWAQLLTGPSPAPRAWDHLFARQDLTGWVRLHLLDPGSTSSTTSDGAETVSGRWLVGAFSGSATGLGGYSAYWPTGSSATTRTGKSGTATPASIARSGISGRPSSADLRSLRLSPPAGSLLRWA